MFDIESNQNVMKCDIVVIYDWFAILLQTICVSMCKYHSFWSEYSDAFALINYR